MPRPYDRFAAAVSYNRSLPASGGLISSIAWVNPVGSGVNCVVTRVTGKNGPTSVGGSLIIGTVDPFTDGVWPLAGDNDGPPPLADPTPINTLMF